MTRSLLRWLCALLILGGTDGCNSDRALSPSTGSGAATVTPYSSSRSAASSEIKTVTVVGLRRSESLDRDVSATAVIGPEGGALDVKSAGGRIVFSSGAVRSPTRITMTAKAGWNVAYEFAPHGLSFDAPVVIEQDLKYTSAYKSKTSASLQAGYYRGTLDSIFLDETQSRARVSELRGVEVNRQLSPRFATFFIYHFSGYIMSSGFADGGGGNDSSFELR